jgi:hypothetical protein
MGHIRPIFLQRYGDPAEMGQTCDCSCCWAVLLSPEPSLVEFL